MTKERKPKISQLAKQMGNAELRAEFLQETERYVKSQIKTQKTAIDFAMMFGDFEREKFPAESCVVKNPHEDGILDSLDLYLCLIVDQRWPNQCRLEYLRPYTAAPCEPEDEGKLFYGWSRVDFDGYVDHAEHSIHEDHERVRAWKKVETKIDFYQSFRD
jgi:hypothetical protein